MRRGITIIGTKDRLIVLSSSISDRGTSYVKTYTPLTASVNPYKVGRVILTSGALAAVGFRARPPGR